jgi:hypothetical protein
MIIAHNNDYDVFTKMLSNSVTELQMDANTRIDYYMDRGGRNAK